MGKMVGCHQGKEKDDEGERIVEEDWPGRQAGSGGSGRLWAMVVYSGLQWVNSGLGYL